MNDKLFCIVLALTMFAASTILLVMSVWIVGGMAGWWIVQ